MSTLGLGPAVLRHLDAQLQSARRLLDGVLRQGAAIRRQDVEVVLATLTDLQEEMAVRTRLEGDRNAVLQHAAVQLGIPAHAVTLEALSGLLHPDEAEEARLRSAELRGLLTEIGREHGVNRVLMRQELAFLDHLTRLLSGGADLGYRPVGDAEADASLRVPATAAAAHRVLDLSA